MFVRVREPRLELLRFTTESYAEVDRLRAWREALDRLGLRGGASQAAARHLHGTIKSRKSGSGFELIALAAFAQTVELKVDGADSLVIVLHLDGDVTLVADGLREPVATGDIVYASSREEAHLTFTSDFRAFAIRVPRAAINARLLIPFSLRAGRLPGDAGIGFLRSIAESVETLSLDELRPLELALAEFLVASLAGHDKEGSFSGLTPSQASLFSRVCRTIEGNLAAPDLGLTSIAKEERVSPRYLQKLFEAVGQNFSTYLRSRRLERCRADLVNPLYEKVSIADVCFRWSFNDPAYFSRAFREQYSASPRTFRHEAGLELARHLVRLAGQCREFARACTARGAGGGS
jgi:AraC-like DNA-binding protein